MRGRRIKHHLNHGEDFHDEPFNRWGGREQDRNLKVYPEFRGRDDMGGHDFGSGVGYPDYSAHAYRSYEHMLGDQGRRGDRDYAARAFGRELDWRFDDNFDYDRGPAAYDVRSGARGTSFYDEDVRTEQFGAAYGGPSQYHSRTYRDFDRGAARRNRLPVPGVRQPDMHPNAFHGGGGRHSIEEYGRGYGDRSMGNFSAETGYTRNYGRRSRFRHVNPNS